MSNSCIPFDTMPFINSPKEHNPYLKDLFNCIPYEDREEELLARYVKNNTENKGEIFTSQNEVINFKDVDNLINKYNEKLYYRHRETSKLVAEKGQIFINEYKNDTIKIIRKLQELTSKCIKNYTSTVESWLQKPGSGVDCEEKKQILKTLFQNSCVGVLYGSAGTGKSTLINHIANIFNDSEKLFLAQTNPAVDNMKRKIHAANRDCCTIAKFLSSNEIKEYDLLVIDESSTVSNRDMLKVLEKGQFKLLLVVGDMYQINSIRFGNWFSALGTFLPENTVHELHAVFRSDDKQLKAFWDKVRNLDGDISELITQNDYAANLDSSIFNHAEENEIILCLNYDGLYGINNINRYLQENNPNEPVSWGIKQYKIGDPILFTDSQRFAPVIFNNTKGIIRDIKIVSEGIMGESIQFDIELDKPINSLDAKKSNLILVDEAESGNSIVRMSFNKLLNQDDDLYSDSNKVIPFQVAYAVSIHKAQGLEYNSVKIIITDEVDELITHNIFYTAITRAQKKLKIYWTPEVQQKVLSNLKKRDIGKDVGILSSYIEPMGSRKKKK